MHCKQGTCKVRNEIETKRNETERNEIKRNETKRRYISFRFVSIGFISFRSVSFRFVSFLFRFALYRYPFNTTRKCTILCYKTKKHSFISLRFSTKFVFFSGHLQQHTFSEVYMIVHYSFTFYQNSI